MYLHTSQVSISLQTPPLISHGELALDFPAPSALWLAPTAEAWSNLFNVYIREFNDQQPNFGSCIFDIREIVSFSEHVDIDLVLHVILCSYWTLIWDYRQLTTITRLSSSPSFSSAEERLNFSPKTPLLPPYKDLNSLLERFQITLAEQHISLRRETRMFYQLLGANLNAPFEYLQILAGMQGEEEARRTYPHVKRWFGTQQSRQSTWHAEQLLRAAAAASRAKITVPSTGQSPSRTPGSQSEVGLQDFNSQDHEGCAPGSERLHGFDVIAIYNAWLILWAYGLMDRAMRQERHQINNIVSHISFGASSNPSPVPTAPECNRPGGPAIHSSLLHGLQNQPGYTLETGMWEVAGGWNDWSEMRPSGTPAGALRSERSLDEQTDKDSKCDEEAHEVMGVPLYEASRVVQLVSELIKTLTMRESMGQCELPFLVESLTRLMEHLGRAADEIIV